ncbi:dihydrolipoyl dehydrogenase family protein [Nocardiopsis suaedae]|uniref:NAD(P)/FAD-dependent oxidoreductase n=1 Tax=Nocardiopsis suaedae TaxID=3018444 RepID=A0ABT4TQI9_9ACTN|nr:NAD(P)/FAD-dependent oxidoreductase [Nocardiopsis suaedae]MDA2806957.1 NAD(P)/FAD-dependent oxidoreductase [Nocardiopsis suaedae]
MEERFDTVVIGMGPGGETVASRLAAAGRRVAVVERELIGGECGYYACIPSKTLLRPPEVRSEAAGSAGVAEPGLDWPGIRNYRDTLVRHFDDSRQVAGYEEQGVTVVKGAARVTGRGPWRVEAAGRTLAAPDIVVATGSSPALPPLPGLDAVETWTNREATTLERVPASVAVIGGGAVAVEMGQFLARMGAGVELLERGDHLLGREEPEVGAEAAAALERDGARVRTGTKVVKAFRDDAGLSALELDDGSRVEAEVVLAATGRTPNTAGLGLEEQGVDVGRRGLEVDDRCRAAEGLWAVGDVTGVAALTHVAKYQGRVVADNLLGRDRRADYTAVPRVLFTDPETAAVGLTARQAAERGIATASAEVDLPTELARPWTYSTDPRGRLGVLADTGRRVLIGAWAVAPMAGEWIHTAALAVRAEVPLDVLADGIAQFPTFNEAYVNAVEKLEG